MDYGRDLPSQTEEQHGGPAVPRGGGDRVQLHPQRAGPLGLPAGVRPLELTPEKAQRIGAKLLSIPGLFEDRFGGADGLGALLMSRRSIVLELGNEDGIMYAEDVAPGGYAFAHIAVFRRRRLPDLHEQIRQTVRWAFQTFRLAYMGAWIPEFNAPAVGLVQQLGWTYDGFARGLLVYGGKRVGAHIFSVTQEEVDGHESGQTTVPGGARLD